MRVFSGFPAGCMKMKNNENIWETLNDLNNSTDILSEVKEEINTILDSLKPLNKPVPVKATGIIIHSK